MIVSWLAIIPTATVDLGSPEVVIANYKFNTIFHNYHNIGNCFSEYFSL